VERPRFRVERNGDFSVAVGIFWETEQMWKGGVIWGNPLFFGAFANQEKIGKIFFEGIFVSIVFKIY